MITDYAVMALNSCSRFEHTPEFTGEVVEKDYDYPPAIGGTGEPLTRLKFVSRE